MRRISAGMVAENSATWRSAGSWLQHPLDVVDEAHAQHLVGLVQHQGLQQRIEVEGALAHVVHDPARGAHHHLGARA
jgi:hypothetical protein